MNRKRIMKIADYYGRIALGLLIIGLAVFVFQNIVQGLSIDLRAGDWIDAGLLLLYTVFVFVIIIPVLYFVDKKFDWIVSRMVGLKRPPKDITDPETTVTESKPNERTTTIGDSSRYFYDLVLASFLASIILAFGFLAYSAWYYVSPGTVSVVSDMASLFITVQGVLLAISVISHAANRTFILFTAMSLMISVITFMLAKVGTPFFVIWGIKNAFAIDAAFFALSIVYYVRIANESLQKHA